MAMATVMVTATDMAMAESINKFLHLYRPRLTDLKSVKKSASPTGSGLFILFIYVLCSGFTEIFHHEIIDPVLICMEFHILFTHDGFTRQAHNRVQ